MDELVKKLTELDMTIATAESYTGGAMANAITDVPGASKVFLGSIVSYSDEIKEHLLGVSTETLKTYGAVSKQCAREMVINVQKLFHSDIAISFTGNAGPTTLENKALGLVYIGFSYQNDIIVDELYFEGSRLEIKEKSLIYAYNKIMGLIS